MADIAKLNKTFVNGVVLNASELNLITTKVDEVIQQVNTNTTGKMSEADADKKYATKEEVTQSVSDKLTKSQADGYYQPIGDYATKEEIPNVDSFITNTVDNLVNYYKKSETYSQSEVNNLLGKITTINFKVVELLPDEGENNLIYLVKRTLKAESDDLYDEYIWIAEDSKYEPIGSTSVDLSNYYNKSEADGKFALKIDIADMLTKTEADSKFALKSAIPTNTSQLTNDSGYLTSIPAEYVTETELGQKGYATETWVGEQGFLTEHQDISNLATRQEVTEGLEAKQDKGDYALKSDLSTLATKEELTSKADKSELANYLTTESASSTYQKKGDYALKSEIPDTSQLATKAELSAKLDKSEASSTYATKTELGNKLDASTYNSEKANFASKTELNTKADKVSVEQVSEATKELQANKYYKFGEVATLTITLAEGEENKLSEYMFEFTSGSTPTTLNLPESVKWIGEHNIEASKTYQVSIVNNLAVMGGV